MQVPIASHPLSLVPAEVEAVNQLWLECNRFQISLFSSRNSLKFVSAFGPESGSESSRSPGALPILKLAFLAQAALCCNYQTTQQSFNGRIKTT